MGIGWNLLFFQVLMGLTQASTGPATTPGTFGGDFRKLNGGVVRAA